MHSVIILLFIYYFFLITKLHLITLTSITNQHRPWSQNTVAMDIANQSACSMHMRDDDLRKK